MITAKPILSLLIPLGLALPGASPAVAERWVAPLDGPPQVLRAFEQPLTDYTAGHRVIDLAADTGQGARAPADGVVAFAGVVVDRPVVSIQGDDGVLASLEPVEPAVDVGDRVSAGDTVGTVATGGHCAMDCLHLGARIDGRYIDPAVLLGFGRRSILLPLGPAG